MPWLPLFLVLVTLAVGCQGKVLTQWPRQEIFASYVKYQGVKLGMTREEVEGIMGPPHSREEGDYRGGHFVITFYRTHNMDYPESGTVRGGYTPLVFQNDRLVGKGKRDYLRAVDRPWSEETPASPTIFERKSW
jgi:hypothetical protein|uniref:DUF3192 domain-containing protein n=1 Tax=Desulfobacca acetoxidans TaxID=60893 RepID=A0A7C5EMT2_9BACT